MKGHLPLVKILILFLFFSCGLNKNIKNAPKLTASDTLQPKIIRQDSTHFTYKNNVLLQDPWKNWELRVQGDPYERGKIIGALSQPLLQKQERVFFKKVEEILSSKTKEKLLRLLLRWYNRKIGQEVPEEFKKEIVALSSYSSDEYDYLAPKYLRSLYLHGAHDIGHAMQDLAVVGCSSFAAWGDKTSDGELLIGRNFDFYAGDEFAEDKIIEFIKPKEGIPFMSVSWGGMIGVVSGMNTQGLTLTLNAGKSDIPWSAKMPISLLGREILQYASTIEEAYEIAKKRKVFVSESLLIGSAKDNKAALIEVSPNKIGLYEASNSNRLICTNHFQSETYQADKNNQKHIKESHSAYRYQKLTKLISSTPKLTVQSAVDFLRSKEGLENENIGLGNEKSLNQLLAHHGIVFKPQSLLVWVSSRPYQLGEFVCFDLKKVFNDSIDVKHIDTFASKELNLQADDFLFTESYKNYETYRILERKIEQSLKNKTVFEEKDQQALLDFNPEYWKGYYLLGCYFYQNKVYKKAQKYFTLSLSKEIPTLPEREKILHYLKKIEHK